jgi:hypothetical protein
LNILATRAEFFFLRGNESSLRQRWRKNTAGRYSGRQVGHVVGHVSLCLGVRRVSWTPLYICTQLTMYEYVSISNLRRISWNVTVAYFRDCQYAGIVGACFKNHTRCMIARTASEFWVLKVAVFILVVTTRLYMFKDWGLYYDILSNQGQ